MKEIDLNIGLAIGQDQVASNLPLARVNYALGLVGLIYVRHRLAQSETEATYVVRCEDLGVAPIAERVHKLAARLQQDCIAAVPRCGAPPFLVGPDAHKWGGCFLAAHWLSLD
jgi:hypothetical protein